MIAASGSPAVHSHGPVHPWRDGVVPLEHADVSDHVTLSGADSDPDPIFLKRHEMFDAAGLGAGPPAEVVDLPEPPPVPTKATGGVLDGAWQGLQDTVGNLACGLDDMKKKAACTMVDCRIDAEYEKFKIPHFEETGITDQSTSEDMTGRQFQEFKKVEKFAHQVMKQGGGSSHRPDLASLGSDEDRLKAIMEYETHQQVEARYAKSIKHGVMGSLDSYLTAGERYQNARFLADALNESKDYSKEVAHGLLSSYLADPQAFLRTYQDKYRSTQR